MLAPVEGQEQIGVGGVVGKLARKELFGGKDDFAFHEFDRGRDRAGADDRRNGPDRGGQVRKGHQQTDFVLRQRQQTQNRFRHNPERAFGTDDQILQTVSGTVFHHLSAEFHDLSVRKNHFKTADVIARDSIFHGAHSAGVRADVPADGRRFFAGIGRIEEAVLLDIFGNVHQQHARLERQREIDVVEFQNAVHSAEVEQDAAVERNRSSDQSRALAARESRECCVQRRIS